jgi:hypothetical protein
MRRKSGLDSQHLGRISVRALDRAYVRGREGIPPHRKGCRAGQAAMGRTSSGWLFWKYEPASGNWVRMTQPRRG